MPQNHFIIRTNIANFEAMLKLEMDDAKRRVVERLLVEAREALRAVGHTKD